MKYLQYFSFLFLLNYTVTQPIKAHLWIESSDSLLKAGLTSIDHKVDSVLKCMTLSEKIGQMNQYNGNWSARDTIAGNGEIQDQIRKGMVGSMLNITGAKHTRVLQEIAMQSKLKIPLLFGHDIIHGLRTTFPIPLAEASSWDMDAIYQSARIAAVEASANGIHWTFAPMVDIARDPRWGRVMEGAGEDPYLGSQIAIAQVKGFQGDGLGSSDGIMACAKHFAAYGAAIGGRDYNSADMSMRQLFEVYLPPFKASANAGVATFMNALNDLNGIPATGDSLLMRKILKKDWNFKGFVVSDWGSVGEMIPHGFAKDNYDAACIAVKAGCDMDMESRSYIQNLEKLVKDGKVKVETIDESVRRILRLKFEMGLFNDPFRFCNENREIKENNNPEHTRMARDVARKSMVLLKNENQLLPLKKDLKAIALIGPFIKAKSDHLGFWSYDYPDDSLRVTSIWEAINQRKSKVCKLYFAKGYEINDTCKTGFAEAIKMAEKAEIVILSVGEARDMSGEAKSRSQLNLPGVQEDLIKAVINTGKPVVVLIHAGRPLIFNYTADHAQSILYTWWLGTEAGHAISDVLFGDYNPSGKLPMTFPLSEGQIPIYYNHYNTGRPATSDNDRFYRSAYTDLSIYPRYPFGFGLSYTTFEYSDIVFNKTTLKGEDTLTASITVKNTGKYPGTETVQLYIQDVVATAIRPVQELKGFQQISLQPGESKVLKFFIHPDNLKFYNSNLVYDWEPGDFTIMLGGSSSSLKKGKITWEK